MKKHNIFFVLILVFLAITKVSFCQWALTGNSGTTAGTNFVGTTDNIDFVFKTNNSEKARILSGGNFGIGTSSPNNLLQIHGGSATAHYIQLTNSATGGGSTSGFWVGINNAVNNGTAELWQRENASMQFLTYDIQRMIIKGGTGATSGYVGIGNPLWRALAARDSLSFYSNYIICSSPFLLT